MAKDEDHKIDFSDDLDFKKALEKDLTLTPSQIGNVKLVSDDEDLWAKIRNNIKNIKKRRRRNRRR